MGSRSAVLSAGHNGKRKEARRGCQVTRWAFWHLFTDSLGITKTTSIGGLNKKLNGLVHVCTISGASGDRLPAESVAAGNPELGPSPPSVTKCPQKY